MEASGMAKVLMQKEIFFKAYTEILLEIWRENQDTISERRILQLIEKKHNHLFGKHEKAAPSQA
jgi:hypothetical protein